MLRLIRPFLISPLRSFGSRFKGVLGKSSRPIINDSSHFKRKSSKFCCLNDPRLLLRTHITSPDFATLKQITKLTTPSKLLFILPDSFFPLFSSCLRFSFYTLNVGQIEAHCVIFKTGWRDKSFKWTWLGFHHSMVSEGFHFIKNWW